METIEHRRREAKQSAYSALGLPNGWFVAATSAEVARGKTLTRSFMSEDLVLYRTQSGEARAVSPYCPHLGAHLGHTGSVEGETIRCAFHGFCFDRKGTCVSIPYGTKPPPTAKLGVKHVREQHGVVLVWHDAEGRAPTWEVPALDVEGWSPFVLQRMHLRGHPQETTENSVDIAHLSIVHGYQDVRTLREARVEGPSLFAQYAMRRPVAGLAAIKLGTEFDVHVHGLGYSLVEVSIEGAGLKTRHLVAASPAEAGYIDLVLGVSVQDPRGLRALGGSIPKRASHALATIVSRMFRHDVAQDFAIWEHKQYVPRPALAAGDGPVALYRRWATQFYGA